MANDPSPLAARFRRELDSWAAAGLLAHDRIPELAANTIAREESRIGAIRAALMVFVTLVATSMMTLSFLCLVGQFFRYSEPEGIFFAALIAYLGAALVFRSFGLIIPAATLSLIGLVASAFTLAVSTDMAWFALLWFPILGLVAHRAASAVHLALLILTGAGVLALLGARLGEGAGLRDIEVLRNSAGLVTLGAFALFMMAWLKRGHVLFEHRTRALLLHEALAIFLTALYAMTFQEHRYEALDIALNLLFFGATTAAVVIAARAEARLAYGIALAFWVLFLGTKYYDLCYDLLSGSAVCSLLGFLMLGLAQLFSRSATRAQLREKDPL